MSYPNLQDWVPPSGVTWDGAAWSYPGGYGFSGFDFQWYEDPITEIPSQVSITFTVSNAANGNDGHVRVIVPNVEGQSEYEMAIPAATYESSGTYTVDMPLDETTHIYGAGGVPEFLTLRITLPEDSGYLRRPVVITDITLVYGAVACDAFWTNLVGQREIEP